MKLVWTYSDRFKKGSWNKNTIASHKYIQFLFKKSIKEALVSLNPEEDDLIMITGSLYLAGELLNLN